MSEQPGHTTVVRQLLDRLAAGDEQAREELIAHSVDRLRRLARKRLREFPAVRRWAETDDVLQNALVRLNRALRDVRPESPRRFVGLAATQIRRELIDLHRHHYGPEGDGRHHQSDPPPAGPQGEARRLHEGVANPMDPAEQLALHEAVDSLPGELREVLEMTVYGGMTQEEIADVLGTSSRTIKRRWRDARLALQERLDGETLQ